MPANKEAFLRYRIIDECLRNRQKQFPSLRDIVERCEELLGKRFSESALQKDIYAMRNDSVLGFHAPIKFNKGQNGYQYTEEDYSISGVPLKEDEMAAIEFAAGVLSQFKGVKLLSQFESAIDKILHTVNVSRTLKSEDFNKIIQVERASYFKGHDLIGPFIHAILHKKVLEFSYHSFASGKTKTHLLHPYLLREFRNRWYVIGWHHEIKKVRTFGLDRISALLETKEKYHKDASFDAAEFFKYSFGITVDSMVPQEIVLSFSPREGNFIKSQALHETQEVLIDNEKETRVKIKVIPSYELRMQVLSYGPEVKVIRPKWLADEVKNALKEALGKYK